MGVREDEGRVKGRMRGMRVGRGVGEGGERRAKGR
jgi:hypothetical protein